MRLVTFVLFCGSLSALLAEDGAAIPSTSYRLLYTGKTLGYYRVPDVQTTATSGCSTGMIDLEQVRAFREQTAEGGGPQILVGMGDNFSPEFNTRMLLVGGRPTPKDLMQWDFKASTPHWIPYDAPSQSEADLRAGKGSIGFDNAGCFFKIAGYDAMVPGKHDFEFGPERLRLLARYLHEPLDPNKPNEFVEMLGANLAIATKVANPPADTPDPPKPTNYGKSSAGAKIRMAAAPLPFLREFEVEKGAEFSRTRANVRETLARVDIERDAAGKVVGGALTTNVKYPFGWLCLTSRTATFDPTNCVAMKDPKVDDKTGNLTFSLPESVPLYPAAGSLNPGKPHHFCASQVASGFTKTNTICGPTFYPHQPFFDYGDSKAANHVYRIVERDGVKVAIFGIVDPGLREQVGLMNSGWLNASRFDTQIEAADPLESLVQALQACEADPRCRSARGWILLAQMPRARAERLGLSLRGKFDTIVAQADEAEATANVTITHRGGFRTGLAPALLVPATHFDGQAPEVLNVTLQSAVLEFKGSETVVTNQMQRKKVALKRVLYSGSDTFIDSIVKAKLAQTAPSTSGDARAAIETALLAAMQRHCHADIALLQQRDFFRAGFFAFERPSPPELQALLDRLLWKGDLILCRPVTGATIKKVLARSAELEAAEQDTLAETAEFGRGLLTLGVVPTEDKEYVINGTVMQDQTLYTLATTDFLAIGDTGYPALSETPVPPAQRLESFRSKPLFELSTVFCLALTGPGNCRQVLTPENYFDTSVIAPPSNPSGLTTQEKFAKWASTNWAHKSILAGAQPYELAVQDRRIWSVRLDKADFGLQQNLHSLSESQRASRFSGVQAAQATAPEKIDLTEDWLLRATVFGRHVDVFAQTDADYELTEVTTVVKGSEPYQTSQPKNTLGFESGITTRLIPFGHKNTTGLKMLTSVRFETELGSPFVIFQATDGLLKRDLPRRNTLFGKVGLRYEGEKSWVEGGFNSGPFNQISSLTLSGVSCTPDALSTCVNGASLQTISNAPYSVTVLRRMQSGFFFNARVHAPLLVKKWDYVIENKGTFYFTRPGDSSADTKFLEVLTHSLTIPVIGNFSLVPKVDLFFFENRMGVGAGGARTGGFFIHGYQTSIAAHYRFDWHTGLRFRSALRYANPAPNGGQ